MYTFLFNDGVARSLFFVSCSLHRLHVMKYKMIQWFNHCFFRLSLSPSLYFVVFLTIYFLPFVDYYIRWNCIHFRLNICHSIERRRKKYSPILPELIDCYTDSIILVYMTNSQNVGHIETTIIDVWHSLLRNWLVKRVKIKRGE